MVDRWYWLVDGWWLIVDGWWLLMVTTWDIPIAQRVVEASPDRKIHRCLVRRSSDGLVADQVSSTSDGSPGCKCTAGRLGTPGDLSSPLKIAPKVQRGSTSRSQSKKPDQLVLLPFVGERSEQLSKWRSSHSSSWLDGSGKREGRPFSEISCGRLTRAALPCASGQIICRKLNSAICTNTH